MWGSPPHTSLPLVYPGWGWGWFGTMVRTSACKAAFGVCVGSNPLPDSLPLSLPSCGLRRVINFRCWLDTTSVCGTGHVSRSSLVATGGITQVIFLCHQLLTLFGFVIIFWTLLWSVWVIIFWLPTERLFTQPFCLWKGNQVATLLNVPDSDLTFPGQSRLDSLCLVPVLEKELTMTELTGF